MVPNQNKEQEKLTHDISKDVADTSLSYLETKLTDDQKTAEELVSLGTNVSTEQLFTKELLSEEKKRPAIIERFSPPQIGNTTLEQIEKGTDTEAQAELAALMSGGIGFTLIGRLRKGVIDTSGHDLQAGPFPPETIQKIVEKAHTLGINNIQSTQQMRTVGQTMGIDLSSQEPFLAFLEQDTPLSKELRETYLSQISAKMEACMTQFLTSYIPSEKKETKRGTIAELMPTKEDLQRKDKNGERNRDNVKSFMGKTAVIGGATVALVKGIKRLFGGGSKKKEKKEKGWFGRTMDKVRNFLMIGGAATVGHRLITGEWFWGTNGEVDPGGPGNIPGEKEAEDYFKEYSPEQRAAYDATAQAINEMYTTHVDLGPEGSSLDTDMLGESSFENTKDGQEATGLMIAILDKRYSSVDKLTANSTIYKEIYGNKIREKIDRVRDASKDAFLTVLAGAASLVNMGFVSKILGMTDKEEAKKFLDEHPEVTGKFHDALRKYMKIIGYFGYKKQQLPGAIARQHLLKTDTTFATLSAEEQNEKIDNLLDDGEFVTTHIEPALRAYTNAPLSSKDGKTGAIQLLQSYQVLDGKLIPADEVMIEKITKEHQELIQQDEEGNCFDIMREAIQTDNQAVAKEQLALLHSRLQEHLGGEGSSSRRSKYLPLLAFFDTEEQMKKHLFQDLDIGGTGKKYLGILETLSKKEKLTEADITKAEQTVADYQALMKEIAVTDVSIQNITKENGQVFIDIGHTVRQHGESFITGIRLIVNEKYVNDDVLGGLGDSVKGLAMLGGAVVSAQLVSYPVRMVVYPFHVVKNALTLKRLPKPPSAGPLLRLGKKAAMGTVRKGAELLPHGNYLRRWSITGRYNKSPQLLWADLANGKLTPDEAQKIAFRFRKQVSFTYNGHSIQHVDDLFKRAFNIQDAEQIQFLKQNRQAPWRRHLVKKGNYVGNQRSIIGRLKDGNYEPLIDQNKLLQYMKIHNEISTKGGVQGEFFKTLFQHSKDELFVQKLLKEPFPKQLALHAQNKHIDMVELAKARAKYGNKAQLPAGKTHLSFLSEIIEHGLSTGKIKNTKTFANNLVRRRPSMTANAKNAKQAFDRIENGLRIDMNATRLERGWKQSQELLSNVVKQLEKVKNNPRLSVAYKKTVGELIEQSRKGLKQLTPDNMQQVYTRMRAGKVNALPQGLKTFFQGFNKSKGLRLLGSVLGKILIVGGVGFTAFDAYSSHQEADAYTLNNEPRKKALRQEAQIKTGILVAEGATIAAWGSAALFGAAAGANAVPVAGQIASAILAVSGVVLLGTDYYFDAKKERLKNEEDFFHEAVDIEIATKQNIIAATAYKAGQTRSFKQGFHNVVGGKYFGTIHQQIQKNVNEVVTREKYIKHAIKTLIGIDELKVNGELRQEFVSNGGGLQNGKRPKNIEAQIEQRYTALTKLYGTPPIKGTDTEHDEGITILSRRIHASRWFSGEKNETTPSRESREQEITQDARYSTVKKQFETYHTDLVHYRHNSEQVQSRISLEENNGVLLDNLRYFAEFMTYQKYLTQGAPSRQDKHTAEKSKFSFPDTPRPINEQTVDMQEVIGFFTNREKKPTAAELSPEIDDSQFEKERNISSNIGQQVLYRLCNELFGYSGPNMLREDQAGKQGGILGFLEERETHSGHANEFITGIYYDKGKNMLKINKTGALSIDNKICVATPEALNNIDNVKKITTFLDKHNIFETKNRLGEKTINTELTKRAKDIVYEELRWRSAEGQKKTENQLKQFRTTHGNKTPLPLQLRIDQIRSGKSQTKNLV